MPGNLPQTTQDRWQTAHFAFAGGITDSTDELTSSQQNPGALGDAINYETGLQGGYRRINGYTQFETAAVTGTGSVLGVVVFPNMGVVAAKNNHVYYSPGSGGWTKIDAVHASSFTASIAGNTLHVTVVGANPITPGTFLTGAGVPVGTIILSQSSGTTGGIGDYTLSGGTLTISSEAMTATFATRTTPSHVRFAHFNFGTEKIVGVDSVNAPFTWDGTNYVELTSAPIGASYAFMYANYLFLAKGSLLYFSAPTNELDWNGADGAGVINIGFRITGLRSWRGTLYIFGESRISSLVGSVFGGATPDAILDSVTTNIGCIAPDSIVEISGDVLYLASDGIRTISGTTRIGDIELAAITDPVHTQFLSFIQQYTFGNFCAAAVRSKNQYRLFASNTGTTPQASAGWLTCIRGTGYNFTGVTPSWEHFKLQGINCYCVDSGYINEVEYIVHGSFDGFVYRQEQGNSFNGDNISHLIRLSYNGYDDPELRKTFYKLKTNILSEGVSSFTVELSFDYGTNTTNQPPPLTITTINSGSASYGTGIYGVSMYNSTVSPDFYNYAIGSGLNMALVYSGNDNTSAPFTIRSVVLDYQVNGRR